MHAKKKKQRKTTDGISINYKLVVNVKASCQHPKNQTHFKLSHKPQKHTSMAESELFVLLSIVAWAHRTHNFGAIQSVRCLNAVQFYMYISC